MSSIASGTDTKEQVKQAIDIVDLIGGYLPLRREGRGFKALCPWHSDTRPSLQVNPERQSWKCWVCNVGGDIFDFIMKQEGVEFRQALTLLAEKAGIPLVAAHSPAAAQAVDLKQQCFDAMAWAEEQFHQCLLHAPEADPARRYLVERGITPQSIARFRIGFAPDRWDWLIKRSQTTAHKLQTLEKVNLVTRSQDSGKVFDRFRGRVMFSIRDTQRRCVAFGGRVLPDLATREPAKYINTSETPLFSKSTMLYGLDVARDAIAQGKPRTALVMEGYTDVIVAHQCGFEHAVAVLGTALGERHLPLLRRFADRVVLMLDGDDAGQRRTNEVLGLFVQEQLDLQILTLPDGLDPCDFLLQRGAEAFKEQLTLTVDALEHKFQSATRGIDGESGVHAAQKAMEEVLTTLAQAPRLLSNSSAAARVKEDQILHRLSRRFGIGEETLRNRMVEMRRQARPRSSTRSSSTPTPVATAAQQPMPPLERALWEVLLLAPERAGDVCQQIVIEQLQSAQSRIIFMKCRELSAAEILPSFERLMLEFDESELKNLLVELDEQGREKEGVDPTAALNDVLGNLRRQQWDQETRANRAAIDGNRLDEDQTLALFNQVIEQRRSRMTDQTIS